MNFGYVEHPAISNFFLGPFEFEITRFHCISTIWIADADQIKNICEISKEIRLVDKCLENFLMLFLWADRVEKIKKYVIAELPACFHVP